MRSLISVIVRELKTVGFWVFAFGLTFMFLVVVFAPPATKRKESPLDAQLRQERQDATASAKAQREADEANRAASRAQTCKALYVCQQFQTVRQTCATAGDFQNCIRVKMGSDFESVGQCNIDGTLAYVPTEIPGAWDCGIAYLKRTLGG